MSEPRAEKECPFCCERVDERARRCPHCRTQQTRWAITLHPAFTAAFFLAFLVMGGVILAVLYISIASPGESSLVPAPAGLRVANSALTLDKGPNGPVAIVAGSISNDGKTDWESVEVEGTVVDKDGRLVDVFDNSVPFMHAGQRKDFRMGGPAYLPPDRYARATVKVLFARKTR